MRSNSYTAIAGSTSSSLTSAPIPVSQMTQFSVIVSVAGDNTAAGTVTVQASNDVGTGFPVTESSPSPWVTLPGVSAVVSGNGQVLIPITNVAYQFIRVVYTRSAGTGGVIVCTVDTTGPSPGIGFWPGGDLAGTVTSQTVVGIQGNPVSSTAPALNETLVWSGTEWAPGAGGGGGGPVQPAAWGNEVLWWKLNDASGSGTAANSGSETSADLSLQGSGLNPLQGLPGPYSLSTRFLAGKVLSGASGKTGGITDQFTLSVWAKELNQLIVPQYFINAGATGGGHTAFIYIPVSTYQIEWGLATASGLANFSSPAGLLSYAGPVMLAMTYDGATVKAYVNGLLVASAAATGNINFNPGSLPAYWTIGGGYDYSGPITSTIYDVRVAPSVRTAAQLIADYKTGMGYSY